MCRFTVVAVALGALGLVVPGVAQAHFILQTPASWAQQGDLGDPQKSAPCGQADPGLAAVPTDIVTYFVVGGTVTVTINETIPHPGHYRVALSTTGQSGLPADPPVTPVGTDECGSTVIQNPPVFPVLADGMLPHTSAFSTPQMFSFKLPANMTCTDNCVLQVVEFMSSHGAPCFYHHCANIRIQAGGSDGGGDGGPPLQSGDSGCGCAAGGRPGSVAGLVSMLAVLAVRRLRRRRVR